MRRLKILLAGDDDDARAIYGYMLIDKPAELARMREVIDAAAPCLRS